MTNPILFYVKVTPHTPTCLLEQFQTKTNKQNKLFEAAPVYRNGNNHVVFNSKNPTQWNVDKDFTYIQLYWNYGRKHLTSEKMKLTTGIEVIIIRPVIKGLWLMIIGLIRYLHRVRLRIRKKRIYLHGVGSYNQLSNFNIFAGHDIIKETIYCHAFKRRRIN